MQITKQNSRRKRKQFDGEQQKSMASIDRLPDDILVHILSFLPTRCCVRSSILAKKWRFLWALVPNLNFSSVDHETVKSFSDFFNRFVFIHKGQNINRFCFHSYDKTEDNELIETLVATAIACNVHEIDIFLDGLMLPQCIFTCKTLVDLTLDGFFVNNVPSTGTNVYLPELKKLELMGIMYDYEESLMHLLAGCPVLEELTITKQLADVDARCLHVSSPTLTRLDVEIEFYNVEDGAFEVKLDTPALKYLNLHDYLSEDFSAGMLASLIEADVIFKAYTERDAEMDVLYSRSVLEFVGKLNNVNSLKLTTGWNYMEVPESAFSALATEFRVLTKLELGGDLRLVAKFLEISDNLQVLDVCMGTDADDWIEPKQVPLCMTSHLEKVRFYNFKCSELEFNMVRFFLRNSKVLKRMEIISNCYDHHRNLIDWKKEFEALQRISLFERASEACQLAFE